MAIRRVLGVIKAACVLGLIAATLVVSPVLAANGNTADGQLLAQAFPQAGGGQQEFGPGFGGQGYPGGIGQGQAGFGQQMGQAGFGQQMGQAGFGQQMGQGIQGAPVPQYWVADAVIFTQNAANTAQIMLQEQRLDVQAPHVMGSQAAFMVSAINRALQNLHALEANAVATKPTVVGQIRATAAQLSAALAQANQLYNVAINGQLGPTYVVTVSSALDHLQAASSTLSQLASTYGMRLQLQGGQARGAV